MAKCFLVLGMHRSGTSAVAGALELAGVSFGENLMPPRQAENSGGYFENLAVYSLHEQFLSDAGYSWDDVRSLDLEAVPTSRRRSFRSQLASILESEMGDRPSWAVKDPRLSYLLPLWRPVLQELGVSPVIVVVTRHPNETAASLQRRNGFSIDKSDLLWLRHTLAAEFVSRDFEREFISFSKFLAAPVEAIQKVLDAADGRSVERKQAVREAIETFVDPGLRHHRFEGVEQSTPRRFDAQVVELVSLLDMVNTDRIPEASKFDRCARMVTAAVESVDPLVLEHIGQLNRRGHRRLEQLDRRLEELTNWVRIQKEQLDRQRSSIVSVEEQLDERTEWLKIQDRILHEQIPRVDALERRARDEQKSSE